MKPGGTFRLDPGYYKDEEKFLAVVEEHATSFRPVGQLIHTYTRPSPAASKDKGKGVTSQQSLDPESDDTIVFEAYHVSLYYLLNRKCLWGTSGDVEYA